MAVSARQSIPIARVLELEAHRDGQGYRVHENGQPELILPNLQEALYGLYRRVHLVAFELMADHLRLHAGCGRRRGRRFLVLGGKRSGKTPLMTRLLFDGFEVDADESVFYGRGVAVPFPRRFHFKGLPLDLLPELAPFVPSLPTFRSGSTLIHAFDPGAAGFHWRIEPGPVDALFVLEPDRGAPARLERLAKIEAARWLAASSYRRALSSAWLAELARLADHADCYRLTLGALHNAVVALDRAMA